MKLLEYKIAWIDDQPDRAQGYYENINNRLGRSGFSVKVDWISKETTLTEFLNRLRAGAEYDAIMVDWKLGKMVHNNRTGTSVANQIRVNNSFATIIFYSAATNDELRKEIAGIDGVFCVNRQHFVAEAMNIIKASIRKFSDLNAMRGLFLAAVAEFDHIIRESAVKAYQGLPAGLQQPVKDKLIDSTAKYLEKQIRKVQSIDRTGDLTTVLETLSAGSKQLSDCLIDILSSAEPSTQHAEALKTFAKYEEQVIVPRNDMAHVVEKRVNGRRYLERGDREWDTSKFDQLRGVLQDHHENITHIQKPLIDELIEHLKQSTAKADAIKGSPKKGSPK